MLAVQVFALASAISSSHCNASDGREVVCTLWTPSLRNLWQSGFWALSVWVFALFEGRTHESQTQRSDHRRLVRDCSKSPLLYSKFVGLHSMHDQVAMQVCTPNTGVVGVPRHSWVFFESCSTLEHDLQVNIDQGVSTPMTTLLTAMALGLCPIRAPGVEPRSKFRKEGRLTRRQILQHEQASR